MSNGPGLCDPVLSCQAVPGYVDGVTGARGTFVDIICRKSRISSILQPLSEVGFCGITLCDNHLLRYGMVPSWF